MDGFELNIDISALQQADKKIKDMITHTTQLQSVMSNVFGKIDVAKLGMALGKVQGYFEQLSQTKVTPNVDTTKLEHLHEVMENIVQSIGTIAPHIKAFYDTSKIPNTTKGLWDVEQEIKRITDALKDTKTLWDATFDLKVDKSKFQAPVHTDGRYVGQAYGKNSDTYKNAYAEWEQAETARLAGEAAATRESLEHYRQALQERLEIAEEDAKKLRMTAAARADYVIAQSKRETQAVQQEIKARQSEYAKTLAEMRKRQNEIANLEKGNASGQNDAQIHGLENRYIQLNEKRKQLEQDYGQFLVEIAEKHNADILAIEAKRIKAKRQLEDELWQKELETPEGALMSAEYAKTINEMKQAQKNVLAARNKTDVNDVETINKLNKAYINLRANIEDLTKAEKNEQSLQPTLRNEYARLIRELDKLQEAEKDWRKTSRLQEGDAEAKKALEDLIQREQDVQARINDIRAGAGNKLDQEDRRFAAEKAQRELAETERLEAQKNAIRKEQWQEWNAYRQKKRTIDADTANRVLQNASQSNNVVQAEKAIERLKNAIRHLNTEDEKYEQTLERLNKEIEKHTHEIKKATDASYRDKDKYGTYDGALKYKEEARTLKDQIKAIEYLKIARQNLDRVSLGESEYKRQMEKLNKEIRRSQREVNKLQEDFKNFNSKAGDLVGQLSRRMAMLFSVSAIEGYVQKIASIRGEFEIQQRSLQVLIGSQEEANKIWEQTVALAVKSPFRVKELVTYTKQLAAYRIETEKLHDTTKMLADVSSGLGVDMNRLILAYGQVKAANYLRGTELRQFSEAGVNLLKDLADYFTVVEGRAVSVAEVFDRVSKRMVTFEHVDTIIRNMTSEGGQFYKMQEKQSETLKGMLMNFQDSMDLMMNDIGKDYEGALKTSVSLAKTLVEQWRMMAPLITVASSVALVFMGRLVKAKLAAISLSATLKSISPMGWATMAAGLAYAIYQWIEATQQFKKELREVERDMTKTLSEGLYMYRTLAEACNDATKSEEERHEAYVKLSTQFKEILPDQLLELEYVRSLAGDYKEVERAMQSYYNNKARQLKLDKIETKYGKDIQTDLDDLIVGVDDFLDNMTNVVDKTDGKIKSLTRTTKDEISMVFGSISTQVVQDIKDGEIAVDDMLTEIKSRLTKYFKGDDIALSAIEQMFWTWQGHVYATTDQFIRKNIGELADELKEFRKQTDFVTGLPTETQAQKQAIALLKDETAAVEELQQAYNKLTNLYVDRAKAPDTGKDEYTNDIDAIIDELTQKYPRYQQLVEEFRNGMSNAKDDVWGLLEFSQRFESKFVRSIANGFGLATQATSEYSKETVKEMEILVTQTQEKLENLANNKAWTDGFKLGIEGIKKLAKQYNISLSDFANYMPKVEQTSADLAKQYDALADSFKQRRESLVESMTMDFNPMFHAQALLSEKYTVEQLQNLENFWSKVAKMYGHHEKDTSKGAGKDWFAEMGKAIRDTHKDFLTLHKDLDKTRALNLAMEKHSDVFEEAAKGAKMVGLSLRDFERLLVEDNAISALEDLLRQIPETASKSRLAIEKMIGEIRGGEDVRKAQEEYKKLNNQIEQLFGTYELSLELKDMNIPTDLAEKLFNFESIDLSGLRQKVLDELGVVNREGTDAEIVERLKKGGASEERIKLTEDTLKKIAERESKALEERMKKYAKFLEQEQTERIKIKLNEVRQLMEIEDTFRIHEKDARKKYELTDEQWKAYEEQRKKGQEINLEFLKRLGIEEAKAQAILEQNRLLAEQKKLAYAGVSRTTQEQLDKDTWESFKKSGYYEMMFSDLEHLGSKAIDSLYEKLNSMQDALKQLPPEVYKEIQSTIDKVESIKLERNPFEALRDAWKEVRDLNKNGIDIDIADPFFGTSNGTKNVKGEEEIAEEYARQEERLTQLREEEAIVAAVLAVKQGTATIDQQQLTQTKEAQGYLDKQESDLNIILKGKQKEKKLTEQNAKELKKGITAYQGMKQAVSASWKKTGQWAESIKNTADATDELLDSLGVAEDSAARIAVQAVSMTADMIVNVIQLEIQMTAAGIAANSMLGIIGWIAIALQAVAKIFTFIFGLHDANLQAEIERIEDRVESLRKAFEKLEQQMEEAYQIDTINDVAKKGKENLEQQIEATRKMIALEREKKDTDEDKIKEWQDEIEEANEKIKELEIERRQALGGLGGQEDYKSAAESFVDAWLDAYRETGNGMKGLEEQYDEMITNMIKKQLTTRVAEKTLAPFFSYFDSMFDETSKGGARVTEDELQRLERLKEDSLMQMNDQLSALSTIFGKDMMGQAELGTLQKGIQGITEDQADILASYLNTIRFFVAEQNSYLQDIAMAQGVSQQENPMVEHLKVVAEQTTAIHELLDNLLAPHPTQAGRGLKVVI